MKVIWEISDGYCGNAEHEIEIPDEEFEGCNTEEIEEIINDTVRNEFEQTVSFEWRIESKNER